MGAERHFYSAGFGHSRWVEVVFQRPFASKKRSAAWPPIDLINPSLALGCDWGYFPVNKMHFRAAEEGQPIEPKLELPAGRHEDQPALLLQTVEIWQPLVGGGENCADAFQEFDVITPFQDD
jgi:hypothetical protein